MQPTPAQGEALVAVAHTLRPDWNPHSIRTLLQRAHNLPATNHHHALNALITYTTRRKPDGTPLMRTPALYPTPGWWWDETTPGVAATPTTPCPDHPEQPAHHCRNCWADIKCGDRPAGTVGQRTPEGGWPTNPGVRAVTGPVTGVGGAGG